MTTTRTDAKVRRRAIRAVVVAHSAGTNTFRWEIVDDTLTLNHLESSMPPFEGVPEEVFQRALYMTVEFTRVP